MLADIFPYYITSSCELRVSYLNALASVFFVCCMAHSGPLRYNHHTREQRFYHLYIRADDECCERIYSSRTPLTRHLEGGALFRRFFIRLCLLWACHPLPQVIGNWFPRVVGFLMFSVCQSADLKKPHSPS